MEANKSIFSPCANEYDYPRSTAKILLLFNVQTRLLTKMNDLLAAIFLRLVRYTCTYLVFNHMDP